MNTKLDTHILPLRLRRYSNRYAHHAVILRDIARHALERLRYMKIKPSVIFNLGARDSFSSQWLQRHFPAAKIILVDTVTEQLNRARKCHFWQKKWPAVSMDGLRLPFADQSCQLIFSNLWLNECVDLKLFFSECLRVLAPNGLFLFTLFGLDTLKELRDSFAAFGRENHVHDFMDMHNVGDWLLQANFSDPVMDMEHLTVFYSSVSVLLMELKALGMTNLRSDRVRGLLGKNVWRQIGSYYESLRVLQGIPATIEVIYGHAWSSGPTGANVQQANEVGVPLSSIRRSLK